MNLFPEESPVREAFARVVFAWDESLQRARFLRPGLLVPFELRKKPGKGPVVVVVVDWFSPKEPFDHDFAFTIGQLVQDRGDCYPIAVAEGELPPLAGGTTRRTSTQRSVDTNVLWAWLMILRNEGAQPAVSARKPAVSPPNRARLS
jgi:hypothetical protein